MKPRQNLAGMPIDVQIGDTISAIKSASANSGERFVLKTLPVIDPMALK
jgi:hypothetical protein